MTLSNVIRHVYLRVFINFVSKRYYVLYHIPSNSSSDEELLILALKNKEKEKMGA